MCSIVNFNDEGFSVGYRDTCVKKEAACPCGDKAKMCTIEGQAMCVPSKDCPCKEGQTACQVEDFNKEGGTLPGGKPQCVTKGSPCPCGKNSLKCVDPQDTKKQTCQPKFSKDVTSCPQACTKTDEDAGKKTCIKKNVDAKGNPTGESVTCVAKDKCTPGKGQKKCPAAAGGATIATGVTCKDIYGIAGKAANSTRRLVQSSANTQQKSSITFTLDNVIGTAANVPKVKVQVDSHLQLPSSLKTELKITMGTGTASMIYSCTNLGTSLVTPASVTGKLRDLLNAKDPTMKTVFAPLGTVKLGPKGCCSLATDIKTVVEKVAKTTSTTERPTTTTKKPTTTTVVTTVVTTTVVNSGATPAPTPAETLTGKVEMAVTLPDGVNATTFLADPKVKAGVKNGIADSLNCSPTWVVITGLSLDDHDHGRRLGGHTGATAVVVDYVVTVPGDQVATKAEAIKTTLGDASTDGMAAMSAKLTTAINTETGQTYTAAVSSVVAPTVAQLPLAGTTGTNIETSACSSLAGLLAITTVLANLAFSF
jgi:hypothetical protein